MWSPGQHRNSAMYAITVTTLLVFALSAKSSKSKLGLGTILPRNSD